MQTIRTVLLAGAAAVVLMTGGGLAAARSQEAHVMTIRLPGGGVEEIHYTGDVAPRVFVSKNSAPIGFGWPAAFFGPDPVFAEMDRISAAMDRQMALMLRGAQVLAAEPGLVSQADTDRLGPGSESHYSFVSTLSGAGICGRSVEITSRGDGQKPQVVSRSWGNCGKGRADTGANGSAPPAGQPSDVRTIRYETPRAAPQIHEAVF